MPERIFTISGEEEKKYEELSDLEKIERLEEIVQGQRMMETERCVYLSEMTGKLRTHLHYILGYADIAADETCDEANLKECLDVITTSANKMAKYLLDLKRRMQEDNFRKITRRERKSWAEILENIGHAIQPVLVPKSLTLTVDYSDVEHMEVETEFFPIYLILWNLIEHAAESSNPQGEILVRVREKECEKAGFGFFEIRVQDTGMGISAEQLPNVFEYYNRAERKEKMEQTAKGIGLAVVKRMVEQLEGTVTAESLIGRGNTFTVLLPLRVEKRGY